MSSDGQWVCRHSTHMREITPWIITHQKIIATEGCMCAGTDRSLVQYAFKRLKMTQAL